MKSEKEFAKEQKDWELNRVVEEGLTKLEDLIVLLCTCATVFVMCGMSIFALDGLLKVCRHIWPNF